MTRCFEARVVSRRCRGARRVLVFTYAIAVLLSSYGILGNAAAQTYVGDGINWHDGANWNTGDVPEDGDDVVIEDYTVEINDPTADIKSLLLGGSANLYTQSGPLNVVNSTGPIVTGGTLTIADEAELYVYSSGESYDVRTGDLNITEEGQLKMRGGILRVNRIADVASDGDHRGKIEGYGTIVFDGNYFDDTSVLDLYGRLEAGSDGGSNDLLTLRVFGDGFLDLDGRPSVRPYIYALYGSLAFEGPIRDAFGGTLVVGRGRSTTFSQGWTLAAQSGDSSGRLVMYGETSNPAVLAGSESVLSGETSVWGFAKITSPVIFTDTASVSLNTDAVLRLEGETEYAGGDFSDVGAAEIHQYGDATVMQDTYLGRWWARLANIDLDGDESAPSSVIVQSGATFGLYTQRMDAFNGKLEVRSGANLNIDIDGSSSNFFSIGSGANVTVNGNVTAGSIVNAGGTLWGTGTIDADVTNFSGTLNPGGQGIRDIASTLAGEFTISGDYTQDDEGGLRIQLGGRSQGVSCDLLTIGEEANLGGALNVSLVSSFSPIEGDLFEILEAGELRGTFGEVDLPSLSNPDLHWSVDYDYSLDTVSLEVLANSADFNSDGFIDDEDLDIWKTYYGRSGSGTLATGDANGDANVDGSDFMIWQKQFASGSPIAPHLSAVPEPSTLALLVLSLAAFGCGRRGIG